jgi:hypothetical protein
MLISVENAVIGTSTVLLKGFLSVVSVVEVWRSGYHMKRCYTIKEQVNGGDNGNKVLSYVQV